MALVSEANALRTLRSDIPYWEQPGNTEQYARDGTSVTRRLACYWKDRQTFIIDMLGDARIVGGAGTSGAKLRRDLPEKHPDFDDDSGLLFSMWATEMTFVGGAGWPGRNANTIGGSIAYHDSPPAYHFTGETPDPDPNPDDPAGRGPNNEGLAVYDVTYRPTIHYMLTDEEADDDPDLERSRFVFVTYEAGGENVTLPRGLLKFKGDPPDADDPDVNVFDALAPILFPNAIIHYHWLMVPPSGFRKKTILGYFDTATYLLVPGAVGSVNDDEFDGFPAESLLVLPPLTPKFIHANTGIFLDIDYPLQYRPQTHQRFMRPTGLFKRLMRILAPTKGPFEKFDLKKLFDVSQP